MPLDDYYDQGKTAFQMGTARWSNPYLSFMPEAGEQWNAGYDAAHEEVYS